MCVSSISDLHQSPVFGQNGFLNRGVGLVKIFIAVMSIVLATLAVVPTANAEQPTTDIYIPANIETMWVILQKPNSFGPGDSESLASAITPLEFRQGIARWQHTAKERGWMLVVTAYTSAGDNNWPHHLIQYGGKRVKFAKYKNPYGSDVQTGIEFPVE